METAHPSDAARPGSRRLPAPARRPRPSSLLPPGPPSSRPSQPLGSAPYMPAGPSLPGSRHCPQSGVGMEASPGGPDGGDLAGEGLGRCREGTGFIGDLARVLPPPHPVFPANSGSKRPLVWPGEEDACVPQCICKGCSQDEGSRERVLEAAGVRGGGHAGAACGIQGARRMHLPPIHCCLLLKHKLTLVWGTHTVLTHTSQFLTWRAHTRSLQSLPFSRTHTRAHSGPFGVGRWLTTSRGFFPPQGNLICFLGANLATCPLGLTPQIRRFQIPRKESTSASPSKIPSLGREDPLEKGIATHSSILAWRIPWTEEPGGLQSVGSQRVGHD